MDWIFVKFSETNARPIQSEAFTAVVDGLALAAGAK
jgi:hypothetical protein